VEDDVAPQCARREEGRQQTLMDNVESTCFSEAPEVAVGSAFSREKDEFNHNGMNPFLLHKANA